jgi:hypothetical protein
MDALLILTGVVGVVGGWVWLIGASVGLTAPRMLLAILLPVLTLPTRGLGYPLLPRLLLGTGLLLLIAGFIQLHQVDRDRFDQLVSGAWLDNSADEAALSGRIAGQRFVPDRVIWRDNQLTFEEGPPERIRRSLAIRFDGAQDLLQDTVIQRVPTDGEPWPELLLQWYEGALEAPGLRRVSGPYSLSLRFTPSANGRVTLFVNLKLSEEQATWLRGDAELASTPPWLMELQARAVAAEAVVAQVTEPAAASRPPPRWGDLSVLALLDEPERFIGSTVRLTMMSGRVHEGRLSAITDDRRIVLAQQRGPSTLEFQFNPVDVARLERLSDR